MANPFEYQPLLDPVADKTTYRKLPLEGVSVEKWKDKEMLVVSPSVITQLTETAFDDVSHLLRTAHLEKLAKILKDPEASDNDCFVARELLKNAVIAAERVFPSCQDTGTALVVAKKGEQVFTGEDDAKALSEGIFNIYRRRNLRYSQLAPLSMYEDRKSVV